MEYGIHQIAQLAGTTSRTLRHYHAIGLLEPSRIGANGYRYYDADTLVRLQRILLLRQMGVGLPAIAEVMAGAAQPTQALAAHLTWLRAERDRITRQIASVDHTIEELERGGELMAEDMFDGFDNTQYKEEVEQRWGTQAYADGDRWWRGLGAEGQRAFRAEAAAINEAWIGAWQAGSDPAAAEVQEVARRHYEWIAAGWGGTRPTAEALISLADMYVADERFAANYGGVEGATYVRAALTEFAQTL